MSSELGSARKKLALPKPALAAIAVIVCTIAGMFFRRASFPELPPGNYVGSLRGAGMVSLNGEDLGLYVERAAVGDDLLMVVLESGWDPQLVAARGSSSYNSSAPLPVVRGPGAELTFSGSEIAPGVYEGVLRNRTADSAGRWRLELSAEVPLRELDQKEVREWLAARAALDLTESKIAVAQISVGQQRAEVDRLDQFISEGQSLKRNADKKYALALQELAQVRAALQQRREEARALREKSELSQRLSGQGRLVALARESLERENRWADTFLNSSVAELGGDFDSAVSRAERVAELKREISRERSRGDYSSSFPDAPATGTDLDRSVPSDAQRPDSGNGALDYD